MNTSLLMQRFNEEEKRMQEIEEMLGRIEEAHKYADELTNYFSFVDVFFLTYKGKKYFDVRYIKALSYECNSCVNIEVGYNDEDKYVNGEDCAAKFNFDITHHEIKSVMDMLKDKCNMKDLLHYKPVYMDITTTTADNVRLGFKLEERD